MDFGINEFSDLISGVKVVLIYYSNDLNIIDEIM